MSIKTLLSSTNYLPSFFVLDDEGRRQVIDSENLIAMRHTDKERKEELEKRNRENKKKKK